MKGGYQTIRRFAGQRDESAPRPSVQSLAMRLRDYAAAQGLEPARIEHSRVSGSGSIYLQLVDKLGHRWVMRIGNHLPPRLTGNERPHFDLVSWDGTSGVLAGERMIDAIVLGELPWSDPALTVRKLRPRSTRKGFARPR